MTQNIDLKNICNKLCNSQVIILPTDTQYGLAAIAYDRTAVRQVFILKQRPEITKLPIHFHSLEHVENDVIITDTIKRLAQKFLPGALTIIAKKKPTSRLKFLEDTVAFRIPKHDILLEIIRTIDKPLTMPSANKHGQPPYAQFALVQKEFKLAGYALDGVEDDAHITNKASTIIDTTKEDIQCIREGEIKFLDIITELRRRR